ncbi:hypothetical protein C8R46DRAFT_1035801 [Mycena filopes]|nr:hypothetical protein C8R46DRAFT_1035801 [Mycena filopes]
MLPFGTGPSWGTSPSETENTTIEDLRRELVKAENEIAFLETLLRKIQLGQETSSRAQSVPPITSPTTIHLLPASTISKIFLHFLNLGNPLTLCWVCRSWRIVAMDTVNLWTTPSFVLGTAFSPAGLEHSARIDYLDEMRRWVDRGHTLASTVSMSVVRGAHGDWARSQFLDSLIDTHATGYSALELDVIQEELAPIFNGRSQFPFLQSLSLRLQFLDLNVWLWHRGLNDIAPRLQSVMIIAETVALDPSVFNGFTSCFPWRQLRNLDMLGTLLHPRIWWEILRQCNSLRTGSFAIQRNSAHTNRYSITLRHLVSLHLKFQTRFHSRTTTDIFDATIFESISFPSLEVLRVTAKVDWSDPLPFLEWMQGHSGKLTNLTLAVRLPDATMFEVLRSCPNLEELTLYLPHGDVSQCRPAFQALTEHRLRNIRTLAVISAAATYASPRTARFHSLDGLVFDLLNTITTWISLKLPSGSDLHILADGEVLSSLKGRLLNNLLVTVQISELPRECGFRQKSSDAEMRQSSNAVPELESGQARTSFFSI